MLRATRTGRSKRMNYETHSEMNSQLATRISELIRLTWGFVVGAIGLPARPNNEADKSAEGFLELAGTCT